MKNQQVNFISPSELKVSEHYEKVYGKNEAIDPLLKETIQKEGIKEPLIITKANNIVSGVLRRYGFISKPPTSTKIPSGSCDLHRK